MRLQFPGGAKEAGRSAILVNDSPLLDYGMLTGNPPQFPIGSVEPDAVVVSHGRLDHVGTVSSPLSGDDWPAVHWTPPTDEPTRALARSTLKLHGGSYNCPFTETHVRQMTQQSAHYDYGESLEATDREVTFYNAGHVPGSAHVLVDDGETHLLYTADFHTDDRRLVSETTTHPDADVVICESTYSDMKHEDRVTVEERFVESVRTAVWEGGIVIVPAFAIDRTQELPVVLDAHDIDCYVDGMGVHVLEILGNHPDYVRDTAALKRTKSNARVASGRDGQRKRIARENSAIVTTSGMLFGGLAITYIPEIRDDPTNKIYLIGYQVEGTPGRELVERGWCELNGGVVPVAARTEMYDPSAHADRHGLLLFLDDYCDASAFVNRGDRCTAFAGELSTDGYEAAAPEIGATAEV